MSYPHEHSTTGAPAKKKLLLIGAVALVVLVVVGLGIFLAFTTPAEQVQMIDKPKDETSQTSSAQEEVMAGDTAEEWPLTRLYERDGAYYAEVKGVIFKGINVTLAEPCVMGSEPFYLADVRGNKAEYECMTDESVSATLGSQYGSYRLVKDFPLITLKLNAQAKIRKIDSAGSLESITRLPKEYIGEYNGLPFLFILKDEEVQFMHGVFVM
jgi:hypothetical protein